MYWKLYSAYKFEIGHELMVASRELKWSRIVNQSQFGLGFLGLS